MAPWSASASSLSRSQRLAAGNKRTDEERVDGARIAAFAVLAMLLVLACVYAGNVLQARRSAERYPVTASVLAQARSELTSLPLAAHQSSGSTPRYDRSAFGPAWADVDHNGCDTRNDILARDLNHITVRADAVGCVVESGTLIDPYTGHTITFHRGKHSADVQIDHVVALANAWASGASAWDPEQRLALANDPRNLLAVDGPANMRKSASNAADWLPENTGYRCIYVIRQIQVKTIYQLTVTPQEASAMARTLDGCSVIRPP